MSYRMMVVDDSRVMYQEMVYLLEGSEFEVAHQYQSAEDALEAYGDLRPDLVTMDVVLPGMDGLEASRQILARDPAARIVLISSLDYEDILQKATEIGVAACVFKPVPKDLLLRTLRKLTAPHKNSAEKEAD